MTKVTVKNNQSLVDIAVYKTGKAENAFWIALANNLVPTDPLTVGLQITIPKDIEVDVEMVAFYKRKNIVPATGLTKNDLQTFELNCEEKIYECFKN